MKINVVKNQSGKIVATFPLSNGNSPQMSPVLTDGLKVEELEVSEDYHTNLKAIYA